MNKVTRLNVDDSSPIASRRIHLREISGDSDASLETVGQDLRAARLRRGDDLATVSKVLKIRKDHLESLEEDRVEALPGRTYAVGFVRSYAEYLGLDAKQCVARFKTEIGGREHADAQQHVTVIDEDDSRRLPQGWKIIVAAVVLAMLYGGYYLVTSTNSPFAQPVTPLPQLNPAKPVAVSPPPQAAPQPVTAPTPAGQQASVVPGPAAPVAAPAVAPATTPATPEALPAGQVYGKQNGAARVVLRVHQATRVLVQGASGTVYINRTLQPGDIYNVPNLTGLKLTTTTANAVELDLDGSSMGYAGSGAGIAEALSLDPQSIADRHHGGG